MCFFTFALDGFNFEQNYHEAVLEVKKIEVPGFPFAFNGSVTRWRGKLLLAFRVHDIDYEQELCIHESAISSSIGVSKIGIVQLNEDLEPITEPQILEMTIGAQDPRILCIDEKLCLVFCEIIQEGEAAGLSRMGSAFLEFDGEKFHLSSYIVFEIFNGESSKRHEKNWVPFDYHGHLLFSYSLLPHCVLAPLLKEGCCKTLAVSQSPINWLWGELRGGTPAVVFDEHHYISFFHSSINIASKHSSYRKIPHYFMGAYLFKKEYPFNITHMSKEPIFAPGFYDGREYDPYWHPVCVVFPTGILHHDDQIWVSYGRQDHENWILKLDRNKLAKSLKRLK